MPHAGPPIPERQPVQVRRMFDGIARRYDLLNHLLSGNLDRRWRRVAAAQLADRPGARVLDLCGGTGDLSLELARRAAPELVICCDFSHEMLGRAGTKFAHDSAGPRCALLEADALALPFADGTFDAVTVAFGVRNLVDLDAGLTEMRRVLRPGGRLVVLEFSRPGQGLLAALYRGYLNHLLPRFGDRVSGRSGPYGYLARTIGAFPDAPTLAEQIRACGFARCTWRQLTAGIVAVHVADAADAADVAGGG